MDVAQVVDVESLLVRWFKQTITESFDLHLARGALKGFDDLIVLLIDLELVQLEEEGAL